MSRSSSAHSDLSTLSDDRNNAGIGAASVRNGHNKLPFFEKYNRVYGTSTSSGSISSAHSSNEMNPSSPGAPTTTGSISPKYMPPSPVSPIYNNQSQQPQYSHNPQQQRQQSPNGYASPPRSASIPKMQPEQQRREPLRPTFPDRQQQVVAPTSASVKAQDGSNGTHKREESAGTESATSHGTSGVYNFMSTPETSPDVPNAPVFPSRQDEQPERPKLPKGRASEDSEDISRYSRSTRAPEIEVESNGSDRDEDDILDSYPTPMQEHHGRFSVSTRGGSFDLDDHLVDTSLDADTVPFHAAYTADDSTIEAAPKSPLFQMKSPFLASPNAATRSMARGLPMSQSTPDSLAKLSRVENGADEAGDDGNATPRKGGMQPSLSLNTRKRRSKSQTNLSPSHRTHGNEQNIWDSGRATPRIQIPRPYNIERQGSTPTGERPQRNGGSAPNPSGATGLGLDACLDDLLKEMNRESMLHPSGSSATSTSANALSSSLSPAPAKPLKTCDSCSSKIPAGSRAVKKDGGVFCTNCYAALYLPKCRRCREPIEGKAIGSGDGKLKGKVCASPHGRYYDILADLPDFSSCALWQFHPSCFSCFECSAPFPTGDFYVFDDQPCCARHYHKLNGTLCANSACKQEGIEGPCVSLVSDEGGRCKSSVCSRH